MVLNRSKAWAHKNKREFANKMITDAGVIQHPEPAAFFMAGLPGAGKTEFTKNLIDDLKLRAVRIDMDEIAAHIVKYDPMKADAFREAATELLNAVLDKTLQRKVDFIMDGTFRTSHSLHNIERALKKGYVVKVFYISQEPEIAWDFTQDREKVERRSIGKEGFISGYADILFNIRALDSPDFSNVTLDIVVKDSANKVGSWHTNVSIKDIDGLVNTGYTKEELERKLQ